MKVFVTCQTGLLAMLLSLGLAACGKQPAQSGGATAASTDHAGRCPHDIKQDTCPFCTPALIESEGFCGEHGVAEALCYVCRPYLKAAFRAKGDWCQAHGAPDSQCVECHPELLEKRGTGHG
jgi:cobalt-zinc-cadmium efflux system membrane fusion protein